MNDQFTGQPEKKKTTNFECTPSSAGGIVVRSEVYITRMDNHFILVPTNQFGVVPTPSAPHLLTLKKPMTDPNDNLWLRLAWCDSTTHLISYPQLQADRAPDYPYQIGSPLHCKQNPKLVKEIYCPSELDAFLFDHKS